jgi:hypothetical protein
MVLHVFNLFLLRCTNALSTHLHFDFYSNKILLLLLLVNGALMFRVSNPVSALMGYPTLAMTSCHFLA